MTQPTADEIETLLTRFTNSLRFEHPLELSIEADAAQYVEGLHGGVDAVARLRRDILRVEGGGVFLFTGSPAVARARNCSACGATCCSAIARSTTATCRSG